MSTTQNGRVEHLWFPDEGEDRQVWEVVVGHVTLWAAPVAGFAVLAWTGFR